MEDDKDAIKTYYENGSVAQEYQINKQEEPDGYFRIYHDNGQLKVEMNFTNGVQDNGDVISYHDNGTKARKVTLVNHLMNGPYYEWYRNGQLKTEGIYNDKVSKVLKEWDENGLNLISNIKEESKENIEYKKEIEKNRLHRTNLAIIQCMMTVLQTVENDNDFAVGGFYLDHFIKNKLNITNGKEYIDNLSHFIANSDFSQQMKILKFYGLDMKDSEKVNLLCESIRIRLFEKRWSITSENLIETFALQINFIPSKIAKLLAMVDSLKLDKNGSIMSYLDVYNYAELCDQNGDIKAALKNYHDFLTMVNNDILLFGEINDDGLYTEFTEKSVRGVSLHGVYFNIGQIHYNKNKLSKALSSYQEALSVNPNLKEPIIFHQIGTCMFEKGDHTKCIEFFDKAIELNEEESSDSLYMRGIAYISEKCELHNFDKGKQDLIRYLEYNPSDIKAVNLLEQLEAFENDKATEENSDNLE
jgi:tetratricopeptide (TPR) repeat protein